MGLAAASLSVGTASAATSGSVGTKAEWRAALAHVAAPGSGCYRASYPTLAWHATTCTTAPNIRLAPAKVPASGIVGDGNDYSAVVPGLISQATGTFTNVSAGITERGKVGGVRSNRANAFSLQLNSQFFTGSPECSGASDPSSCQAWQQFVYTYQEKTGFIFMQYWLIDYAATCPKGWFTYSTDCYSNSPSAQLPSGDITAAELASTQMVATASSSTDGVSLSDNGGQATLVTNRDSKVDLSEFWNTTEWGVFGDGGGTEALFNRTASLEPVTALTATSKAAPTCVVEGFTGETNSLKLAHTPAIGHQASPTMASKQNQTKPGVASCAKAS
ncbi:MAG TPA: hypothetical protein VGH27_17835 [Streptosporangiaceae bacterium]|jgi:hypothetical protein